MRFLNLVIEVSVPDARTIWLFREQLKEFNLVEKLFADFDRYLAESGFEAKKGQIIDASIAAAPKQRNSREENGQIKDGEIPKDWSQKNAVIKILMLIGFRKMERITLAAKTM